MNHIELFEKTINDNSYQTLELRLMMKHFNNYTLEQANEILVKLKEFIDMKTNDFMRSE
ncbi:hypothetical protein UFOVP98_34 [uncultured Caudovirales phage]|uniref:Uncharacterized protein n=1 Tax=uncultured Caudovirales phage TaxID=2100421 RepID=A0A6J5LLD4_9CAUD|nr:hypothetical protein UFOVP98_34 [uncultured Caudovirales phage]CAB4134322.1 hypothetical protein UFOVP269_36 [uncultured Caudovirales phage]